jgi:hypothetical protein
MDGMVAKIEEERLVPSLVHDLKRLVGQAVGQILAFVAKFEVRHISELPAPSAWAAVRIEERSRSAPESAADVDIETMCLGIVCGVAEMPLAHVGREVAGIL